MEYFLWSLILLLVWLGVYLSLSSPDKKKEMLNVSFWTSFLGLSEPIFVPEYWNPPSLFNLAAKTGFDLESILFSFAVGGIAASVYERAFPVSHEKIERAEIIHPKHRFHLPILLSAPLVFILVRVFYSTLNPIYAAIISMSLGGLLALFCRPDLKVKMCVSAGLFFGIYFAYFLSLVAVYPGYVSRAWNLRDLTRICIFGIPIEELLFALSFGFLWSGVYEHVTWRRLKCS